MRPTALAGLVLSAVALMACVSASQAVGSGLVRASGPVGAAGQNKADAQAAADQLVAQTVLPPGAVPAAPSSFGLSGPIMGMPGTAQLVDSVAYFSVPTSLAQARAWLEGHPQSGRTLGGYGPMSGPDGLQSYGFVYGVDEPTSGWVPRRWTSVW